MYISRFVAACVLWISLYFGGVQANLLTSENLGRSCIGGYASRCEIISKCNTLRDHFKAGTLTLRSLVNCGFTVYEEIVCCPEEMPEKWTQGPRNAPVPPPIETTGNQRPYWSHLESQPKPKVLHYVSLVYKIQNDTELEEHCTAVAVTERLVLCSAHCLEKWGRPRYSRTYGGVYVPEHHIAIRQLHHYNDVVLLELATPAPSPENLAYFCNENEIDRTEHLDAIGWAEGSDAETCTLFQQPMSLQPNEKCSNIAAGDIQQRRCLSPLGEPQNRHSGGCINCLMGSGSFLHAQLPDSSRCVAGLATPSTDSCLESASPLAFTQLTSTIVNKLVQQASSPQSDYLEIH